MMTSKFLFSRTANIDYRWIYRPAEVESPELVVIEDLFIDARRRYKVELAETKDPVVYFALNLTSGWFAGIIHSGQKKDEHGRAVQAVSGLFKPRASEKEDRVFLMWCFDNFKKNTDACIDLKPEDSFKNVVEKFDINIDIDESYQRLKSKLKCQSSKSSDTRATEKGRFFERTTEGVDAFRCQLFAEPLHGYQVLSNRGSSIERQLNDSPDVIIPVYRLKLSHREVDQRERQIRGTRQEQANVRVSLAFEVFHRSRILRLLQSLIDSFHQSPAVYTGKVELYVDGKLRETRILHGVHLDRSQFQVQPDTTDDEMRRLIRQEFETVCRDVERQFGVQLEEKQPFEKEAQHLSPDTNNSTYHE